MLVIGVGSVALWMHAERQIDRQTIPALERPAEASEGVEDAMNVLVVGTDSRDDFTPAERRQLSLGDFDDLHQADTILLVQLRPDDESATVVSIPRDLRVTDPDGRSGRINGALARGGPDLLVRIVESISEVGIDHYVEVPISGFLETVDAVGTIEICLDEPLSDRRAGADFAAGCHDVGPTESLAFVRSRAGARGDFRRIDRQQQFLRALFDEVASARTFADPRRLVRVVDRVSDNLVTDDALGLREMRQLATELRSMLDGELRAITLPAYADERDGVSYVSAYEPGVRELFRHLREGRAPPARGEPEEREEVSVGLWHTGEYGAADRVESTLFFAGYSPWTIGPGALETPRRTSVIAIEGTDEQAEWIAGAIGGEIRPLPTTVDPPEGVDVLVVVGHDASEPLEDERPAGSERETDEVRER